MSGVMKKVYRVCCFLVSIILTGYLFVHISYMYRGYTRLMGFYGLKKDTVDVVFVGTSVTFSSFMPMEAWNQYGMTAYNYCTNVQFENSLRYSVREIMKTQSPSVMLIDVAPFMYEHWAGNQSWKKEHHELYIKYNIDSMKYSLNRILLTNEINRDASGDLYSYLSYFFDIGRYHTNQPLIGQFDNSYNDVDRGYGYLRKEEGDPIRVESLVEDDGSELPLETCHAEYFRTLLKEVKKLDCNVVFYCAPIVFYDSQVFARKNYLKRIIEEENGVFWDLSTEVEKIGLDYQCDFWNDFHFNSLGAEKVTRRLAEMIVGAYDIPDRRNDPKYANWHEDYQSWLIHKADYNERDGQIS